MYFDKILSGKKVISLFNSSYKLYIMSTKDLEKRYNNFEFSNNFEYGWNTGSFLGNFKKKLFLYSHDQYPQRYWFI